MNDIRLERDKAIADFVQITAVRVIEQSKRISMLTDQLKATSWWRFRMRRRLKRAIRFEGAFTATIASRAASRIAIEISTPIPTDYKNR
jgi:hypothetical protein